MRAGMFLGGASALALLSAGSAGAQPASSPPGSPPAAVAPPVGTEGTAQSVSETPPSPAQAGAASAESATPEGGLQEIVVTAQKRAENLQRVPIAVTAASGAALTQRGITSAIQLNTVAPGLNVRTTSGAFQPSIRGIGTSSNVVENPVALYIDGVYLPNQREGLRELNDIAQIAVLKGPQGTLFGRNATGGVIQITTLAPSHAFSGLANAQIDNYATVRLNAYVTGGLSDTLAASLSGAYAHQGNGYGKNLTTGHDTYKLQHDASVRGKLLFEPGAATKITLAGDYMDRRELSNSFQPYLGLPLTFPGIGPLTSVFDTYAGTDSYNAFKGGGASLTIDQDLSFAKLVSISSYRKNKASFQFDNSGTPGSYFVVNSPATRSEDYTQEVQLISPTAGRFTWVVGAFYFHNANTPDPIIRSFAGPFMPAVARTVTVATEKTESVAPFGQMGWEFLPRTTLTLGARYTYERRRLEDANVTIFSRAGPVISSTNYPYAPLTIKKPTFRVALDHRFTDQILGYVSFNTGIKSGGFNNITPANQPYFPEKLKAYEVGLKSQLFDRNLRLNLAGFYYDYANVQVIQFVGITQSVVNGPGAKLYGLDVDFEVRLGNGLRASGGFEALHSEFTNYPGAVFSTPLAAGGALVFAGNAKGNRLPLAQKFTATTAIDYHTAIGASALDFNVTGNYNGNYYFESDNRNKQKAYFILNSQLKWTLPGDKLSVFVFGKNLFSEKVITQVPTQAIGYLATYGVAPRTYGVGTSLRF